MTLNEAVRKKTFLIMGTITGLYLVLLGLMVYYFQHTQMIHGIQEEQFISVASLMITQMGLQFSVLLMALLTIMLGAGAVSAELENGLIQSILTRPLSRAAYILGKLAGLTLLTSIYASFLYFVILAIGKYFNLSTITALTASQIFFCWLLYLSIPFAILCLTVFGSVHLKTVPNGILMIFIYIMGNAGGMVEMIGGYINSAKIVATGIFISLISPFHTIFGIFERKLLPSIGMVENMARGAGGLAGSGAPASFWMHLYIVIYLLACVSLAIHSFSRKDIQ